MRKSRRNIYSYFFKELYILAHDINIDNVEFIMSPNDMRKKDPKINAPWSILIKESLQRFNVK